MPDRIGRYDIMETLGEGTTGVVYKARDSKFNRIVALKALSIGGEIPEKERVEFLQRFSVEAHAAGNLPHPNIVTIYDTDVDSRRQVPFITMEYVEGRSLEDLLQEDGSFSANKALDITIQVAEGLGFAHKREIVHRDIKPANILLDGNGTVKITDFGIARVSTSTLTTSGQFLGTPTYMSPEQVFGDQVDGRSDLFSLAIVLYQMITGELPFPGNNITTIAYKIVNTTPPPPTHINYCLADGFDALLSRGMAKKPAERFQTANQMIAELKRLHQVNVPADAPVRPPEGRDGSSGKSTQVASPAPLPATKKTVSIREPLLPVKPPSATRPKDLMPHVFDKRSVRNVLLGMATGMAALLLFIFTSPLLTTSINEPPLPPPRIPQPQIVKKYDMAMLAAYSSPAEWPTDPSVENAFLKFLEGDEPPGRNSTASKAPQETNEIEGAQRASENNRDGMAETRHAGDVLHSGLDSIEYPEADPAGMLNLVFRHPYESGRLLLYADNQLVYESSLGQSDEEDSAFSKKMKTFGRKLKLARHKAAGIRIPVGSYTIEVEVVRPDGSVLPRAGLAAEFESEQERNLSILCSRRKSKQLQLEWERTE